MAKSSVPIFFESDKHLNIIDELAEPHVCKCVIDFVFKYKLFNLYFV